MIYVLMLQTNKLSLSVEVGSLRLYRFFPLQLDKRCNETGINLKLKSRLSGTSTIIFFTESDNGFTYVLMTYWHYDLIYNIKGSSTLWCPDMPPSGLKRT